VQSELDVIGSPNASTAVAWSEWYIHMNGTYAYAAARWTTSPACLSSGSAQREMAQLVRERAQGPRQRSWRSEADLGAVGIPIILSSWTTETPHPVRAIIIDEYPLTQAR